jgi:rhomboid protease GluP
MPQYTQTITVSGRDDADLQAIVYGAFESLSWNIKYAGEKAIVAYTPRSWNKYDNEITAETGNGNVTITSKMIHGEAFDMMGKNKKFVAAFAEAFDKTRSAATEQQLAGWKEKIASLKEETIKVAEQEVKQAKEIDQVMNLSRGNLYVTYGIIGINVLVFLAMAASGVSLLQPTGIDIIKWGANYSPLTLSGDWWRLLSCVFVHIGIIHILFNMYALYMVGVYLEPMLGKTKFTVAYLCTGVFASLASIWWHSEPVPSAGASGAIFGMYGVFLALLSTKLIPAAVRNKLLQSIGIFIVYNLFYGLKPQSGIDNSAHIGGLLSGMVIGYLYYLTMKKENTDQKKPAIVLFIAGLTIVAAAWYLQEKKANPEERTAIQQMLGETKYKDGQKFIEKMNSFSEMEDKALAPLQDTTQLIDESLIKKLEEVSLPEWNKAEQLVEEMKSYNVSENSKKKIDLLGQYVQMRKQEIEMFKKYVAERSIENIKLRNETEEKIQKIIDDIRNL